jgi:hypothetical protein
MSQERDVSPLPVLLLKMTRHSIREIALSFSNLSLAAVP